MSIAAIIATGVNTDGRREILGLGLGPSEAAVFWLGFLRSLQARGLKGGAAQGSNDAQHRWKGCGGVKLVISDAHQGLKAAVAQGGGIIGSTTGPQPGPAAYHLGVGSPAIGAGIHLTGSPYNLGAGNRDYYMDPVPNTSLTGFNMGTQK